MTISFLALVTFITRIFNLLEIPIFTDEAIYIRWAQIGLDDSAHRYISLTDGKQPLFTWLMYPFLKIFSDPLFAGRFVSVIAGVAAVIGIYVLAKELFGKKTALFASLLYIFSPFALLYDRLALMDSLLASLFIWSIYLQILLVRKIRLDVALILGMIMGLGLMTKSSAFFFICLLPFSLILFDFGKKNKFIRMMSWAGLAVLSIIIAQIMYNSLRLSPLFYIIEQKNYTFIYTFQEFFSLTFKTFLPNLQGLLIFLTTYLTWPISLVILIGTFLGLFNRDKRVFYLIVCFAFPFFTLAAFGRVLFPRFILFMSMPLLLLAGEVISRWTFFAKEKMRIFIVITIFIFIYPVYLTLVILTNPVEAAIPRVDRNQLFDDWPSGYGVKEVIDYLNQKAKNSKVVIATEGTFGLNPFVYEIYLKKNENVIIKSYWPLSQVPDELISLSREYPTYIVFKESQNIPDSWPLKLINKYRRGKGKTYLLFFEIVSADMP